MADAQPIGESARAVHVDALYTCEQCGKNLPPENVWNAAGKIICKSCYAKMSGKVAANANDKGAVKETPPKISAARRPRPPSLLPKVTCPHCWHRFPPEQILWVSQHSELLGDLVLGPDAASRFLPTRFSVDGNALDSRGMQSQTLACPKCHLVIPRSLIETEPFFVSIVGVPASGKSYFLTAMTWELRRILPKTFAIIFNDADTVSNRILNEYEELLFLQADSTRMVAIRKTEVHGIALYDQIRLGQQIVSLPRPFLFSLRPAPHHPNFAQAAKFTRIFCLYDNAGEAFEPGEDSSSSPVTQHLSKSRVLMFLYDPTQDARFRPKCREISKDPQLDGRSRRQETVLIEMASRLRRLASVAQNQKFDRPLVVIVPKADVWGPLIGLDLEHEPLLAPKAADDGVAMIDLARVEAVSAKIRTLLVEMAPEFVTAAEDFCRHVVYIPVSALGRGPQTQDGQEGFFVPAGEIRPKWVTVPVLYIFSKWTRGLIGGIAATRGTSPQSSGTPTAINAAR
jgi:hypothetical protein